MQQPTQSNTSPFRYLLVFLLLILLFASSPRAASAATQQQQQAYSFQPLSPDAIPSVLIIGAAKAGTTDLYTLLARTSRLAPGSARKRIKEAKILAEGSRQLVPGHPDFHEYLQRIGHPCAASAHPAHTNAPAAFQTCMQRLAAAAAAAGSSASSNGSSSSGSSGDAGSWGLQPGEPSTARTAAAGAGAADSGEGTAAAVHTISTTSGSSSSRIHRRFKSSSSRIDSRIDSSSSSRARQQVPLSIDATPIYLALPDAVSRLRSLSNSSKVVVLLRHPVDRAASLYNHRVSSELKDHHLPPRVSNRTVSEWATLFLDWIDTTPGVQPLLDALAHASSPAQQGQLYQQLLQHNILGLPPGPFSYSTYNREGIVERNIFGTALYAAGLAVWRERYFSPGRVMVIDCHHYFKNRLQVLNDLYAFVHGRPLSAAGMRIAKRTAVQNARRARGGEFAGSKFDDAVRSRLEAFYQAQTDLLLHKVLPAMQQEEGAWVVGFDGPPWLPVEQQ